MPGNATKNKERGENKQTTETVVVTVVSTRRGQTTGEGVCWGPGGAGVVGLSGRERSSSSGDVEQ